VPRKDFIAKVGADFAKRFHSNNLEQVLQKAEQFKLIHSISRSFPGAETLNFIGLLP